MRGGRVEAGRQAGRHSAGVSHPVLRALGFIVFACGVFAATTGAFARWFNATNSAELHAVLAAKPPVIRLLDRSGRVIATRTQRQPHIAIDALPAVLIDAVTATEDRRFEQHWGVDPIGVARAMWRNFATGELREGGSTITQQLVKNVFLSRERTLERKFREFIIAVWLETHYDKRQILELYLNRVYFGAGATYGVEAAARSYFDKSARDLSLAEAAMLAGVLKAPSFYSPARNLKRSRDRAAQVLDNMIAAGVLSQSDADFARQMPARLVDKAKRQRLAKGSEYAEDWIMDQLRERFGALDRDLTVTTSLDLDLQRQGQKLVQAAIAGSRRLHGTDQGAALLLDATGGVRVLIGGANYRESQFNRAVQARRQPGSAFKPIIFLAAMEAGLSPASRREDAPVNIGGWRPRNASGVYQGEVSLRHALAQSINTVAVSLADEIGCDRVIATARRLGIASPLTRHPSLALGSSEVTPLELAAAYVPMMNGGSGVEPHIILRIEDGAGVTLHAHDAQRRTRVIGEANVYDMNEMLGAVVQEGTGRRARLAGHPIAGKTGTSQDHRDAWFVGYSGHFTAAVWMGNDNGHPTDKVTGGSLPAQLWSQLMETAHKGLAAKSLPGLADDSDADPLGSIIIETPPPAENIIVNG